jgi:dTDP-4-dehydrorhamnose reductase
MIKSKILVLGNMGMAGFVISTFLKEEGHEVFGFARRNSPTVTTIVGDVRDINKLKEIIRNENFDYIINCVGVLNHFADNDKQNAIFINSYLPHFLVNVTSELSTKIIHMSTDCVFSGNKGNYSEKDCPDGKTFYDRTKALGEIIDEKNITLRNSIIGPDINLEGIGLFNWFMKQAKEIKGYKKAIWSGLTTLELAKVINHIVSEDKNYYGLTNMVNNDNINKYDLLMLFKNVFEKKSLNIIPVDEVNVNKSLIRENFDIKYYIPSYSEMIEDMKDWIFSHKEFFAHYF